MEHIFIVGNSRSGTTMMGRILSNSQLIFTFRELHFFGNLFSSNDNNILTESSSVKLFSKLLCIQKKGIFNLHNYKDFIKEADHILDRKKSTPIEVFKIFLKYQKETNKAMIACEQTPRNIFYIQEILDNFPNARNINIIRDPRDVLLSQKHKWRRRSYGAPLIPFRESVRSFFNYHPITISKIWNSCISQANLYNNDDRVKTVYFESLLTKPKETVSEICDFIDIEFSEEMLEVRNIGSSNMKDEELVYNIDKSKIGKWKLGGLTNEEVYINQKICKQYIRQHKYKLVEIKCSYFLLFLQMIIFPIKIIISFMLNFRRFKSFKDLINKRLLVK